MTMQLGYDPVTRFLDAMRGQQVRQLGPNRWEAYCPAHDDKKQRSLTVDRGTDGRVLLCCHAGCNFFEIAKAVGMDPSEFFPPRKLDSNKENGVTAVYEYYNAQGQLCLEVYRTKSGKPKFFQRAVLPSGQRLKPREADEAGHSIEPLLYHSARLARAIKEERWIFIVEGEKDVNNAEAFGLIATTNPGGAKKWKPEYSQELQDARVVIIPDNDPSGAKHLERVASSLFGLARTIKILQLPTNIEKGDLSDWIEAGGTLTQLKQLVKDAPEWIQPWSRGLTPEVPVGEDRKYIFGRECIFHTVKKVDGVEEPAQIPFATNVWPRQRYSTLEDGEHGYRIRYIKANGEHHHALIPAGAAITKNAGRSACKQLADEGVELGVLTENMLAVALGYWARKCHPPTITLVRTSGWHRECGTYVNGHKVFGSKGWHVDERSPAISDRVGRRGTTDEWQAEISRLLLDLQGRARSYGIWAALAQSLAGPLIEPLRLQPFILHLWTDSTQGKTTAATLASAVWGDPDSTLKTWNTTQQSPEALAELFNGACLILDDTSKYDLDERHFKSVIHSLCSSRGRASLANNRDLNRQRRWRCTILSTGEISTRQQLRGQYQGGHRVRSIDLYCERGTLALNETHAEDIEALAHEQYGVVGDAWIQHLLQPGVLHKVRSEYKNIFSPRARRMAGSGNEEGRIAGQVAVMGLALWEAKAAGLLPQLPSDDIEQIMSWAVKAILTDEDTGADMTARPSTPNERAYADFGGLYLSNPYRFPEPHKADTARDVVGYRVVTGGAEGEVNTTEIYTTEKMLKQLDMFDGVRVSPRKWVDWCVEQGLAKRLVKKATLPGGKRERWIVFTTDFRTCFTPNPDERPDRAAGMGTENNNDNAGVPSTPNLPTL